MKIIRLSERLKKVASFVEQGAIVADIGSDHAYLPTYLVQTKVIEQAIAGEVAQGPFDSAQRNVKKEGVESNITVRLANGLFAIENEDHVDTVTIAGMGGALIATILEEGKERLTGVQRIITQPNINADAIRHWALANGWFIEDEAILEEDEKTYEIVVLARGAKKYSELELLVGPFLLKRKEAVFIRKWTEELEHLQSILLSLEKAERTKQVTAKIEQLTRQIQFIEEVLVE